MLNPNDTVVIKSVSGTIIGYDIAGRLRGFRKNYIEINGKDYDRATHSHTNPKTLAQCWAIVLPLEDWKKGRDEYEAKIEQDRIAAEIKENKDLVQKLRQLFSQNNTDEETLTKVVEVLAENGWSKE